MRLIDADYFKEQIAAATLKFDIAPNKGLALIELVDTIPTVTTWIPCSEELPPQPKENPKIDNRPIEIYLVVSEDLEDYPFRAFWNGKIFTDGFSKVDVVAWQPLPEPYKPQ